MGPGDTKEDEAPRVAASSTLLCLCVHQPAVWFAGRSGHLPSWHCAWTGRAQRCSHRRVLEGIDVFPWPGTWFPATNGAGIARGLPSCWTPMTAARRHRTRGDSANLARGARRRDGLANQTWGFLPPPARLSVPRLGLSLGHPPSRPTPLPRDQILQVRGSPRCPVSFILSVPAPPAMLSSPGSRDEGEIRYQICPPSSSHHDSEWLFLWPRTDTKQYHRATEPPRL